MFRALTLTLVQAVLFLSPATAGAACERGSDLEVGMSAAFTGPTRELGAPMREGIEAAFAEANREGGIGGRLLRLEALDDGYEPSRTAPNMRKLVQKAGVTAVIGNVGTPTAVVGVPIAAEAGVCYYGAYSGAGMLRKTPPDPLVVNFRASYAQEVSAMVDGLVDHGGIKPGEIAFFTQRDAFGDAGYAAGIDALRRRGLRSELDVVHARYERNTQAVENAAADVIGSSRTIKAVVLVGTYGPCAKFIREVKAFGLRPRFLTLSFVGPCALAEELGTEGDGVIVTQVVPPPESDLPLAKEYRRAMELWGREPACGYTAFEGYAAARVMIRALRGVEGEITRGSAAGALEGLGTFDMGMGEELSLGPTDHQACDRVWATVLRGGEVEPFEWSELEQERGPKSAGATEEK